MGTVVSSIFLCEEVTHIKRRLTWALRPCLPLILEKPPLQQDHQLFECSKDKGVRLKSDWSNDGALQFNRHFFLNPSGFFDFISVFLIFFMVTLCLFNITMENPHFQKVTHDKSSINGYFCIAMFNNQRVKIHLFGAPKSIPNFGEKKHRKGSFWGAASLLRRSPSSGGRIIPFFMAASYGVHLMGPSMKTMLFCQNYLYHPYLYHLSEI
jgi:hypothetical protein